MYTASGDKGVRGSAEIDPNSAQRAIKHKLIGLKSLCDTQHKHTVSVVVLLLSCHWEGSSCDGGVHH